MKQKLTLLLLALIATMSAWAQLGTITYSISTYSSEGAFSSTQVWKSNGAPAMTMTYNGSQGYNTGNGKIFQGNYTLSVTYGFVITGYSITGHSAWNGSNGDVERITPASGTVTDGDGNTVQYLDFAGSDVTLNVTGLSNQSVSFTMEQTAGTGNGAFDATAITITYEYNHEINLPQLTTDESAPKYYSIKSYNRGGYLTSNGTGKSMSHVDFADGSVWYFTAAEGNTSGDVLGGVVAHCYDGTQMTTSWQTAASGGTVYILPNGVNDSGFSISKTAKVSGSSCCDANNNNTGVGNWSPSQRDWEGTTWVFEPTIPSGYYYFKGMDTSRYPYLYSNFVGKSTNETYHHSLPDSPNNGNIWKVTNNGATFAVTNGEGLPLTIGSTTYENLTIGSAAVGPDFYFTEAINLTNWGNDTKLTTWAGHSEATDNHWTFEPVDVSAGIYNVVIEGCEDGYVTYNSQNAKNGGFFVAASIATSDLTASAVEGYTSEISVEGQTITVTYTHVINYTLTDVNGATYEGTYQGVVGEEPSFTGCVGYTLSNQAWDGYNFTATINFPFPVSTPTFLGQFHNKSGYDSIDFLWHAESSGIVVHSGDMPDATSDEQNKYLWTIEPSISGLNMSFAIKNVSTETYITSTATENSHDSGAVTLSAEATPLQYQTSTTKNCGTIYVWYISSTGKYLSVNSVNGGAGSLMGVWSLAATHDGPSTGFHSYLDLITRYWGKNEMAAKLANAGQYGYPATDNEYTVALLGVKTALDGGTYEGNATNYSNLKTWYEGFLAADVVVPPTGKFYRFKANATGTYMGYAASGKQPLVEEGNAAIYYYTDGKGFVNYSTGRYLSGAVGNAVTTVGTDGPAFNFYKSNYSTPTMGTVRIRVADNSNGSIIAWTDEYLNGWGDGNHARCEWIVELVTSLPIRMNEVDNKYYGTINLPVAVTIPEGVYAYKAAVAGDVMTLTKVVENGVLAANTPVVLYSASEVTSLAISAEAGTGADDDAFSGTTAAITAPEGTNYVLSYSSTEGVGFYKYTGSVIPGFKAYFNDPSGSSVKGFSFSMEDVETAIRAIESENNDLEIYDIAGRRVPQAQKGLYIVNGKKVMFK